MGTPVFQLQDLLTFFQKRKILTLQELRRETGCSTMTLWRLLRPHGYFTSYNQNARYYTIEGIPEFDEHGLWTYRNARFSKWGPLTKTIVGVVEESSGGRTANELQQLLHVDNVKPTLTRLIQSRLLSREKIDDRFVYFAHQQGTQRRQQRQRKQTAKPAQPLPPLEHIIALLVEIIRRPDRTPRTWVRRLARQGIALPTSDVHRVLDHYQIDPKKGLLNS